MLVVCEEFDIASADVTPGLCLLKYASSASVGEVEVGKWWFWLSNTAMAEVIASIQSACASSDSARKTYVFSIETIRNAFATKCFEFFGSSSVRVERLPRSFEDRCPLSRRPQFPLQRPFRSRPSLFRRPQVLKRVRRLRHLRPSRRARRRRRYHRPLSRVQFRLSFDLGQVVNVVVGSQ